MAHSNLCGIAYVRIAVLLKRRASRYTREGSVRYCSLGRCDWPPSCAATFVWRTSILYRIKAISTTSIAKAKNAVHTFHSRNLVSTLLKIILRIALTLQDGRINRLENNIVVWAVMDRLVQFTLCTLLYL